MNYKKYKFLYRETIRFIEFRTIFAISKEELRPLFRDGNYLESYGFAAAVAIFLM